MKFSEKLKKLRADSDISQEELAEKVHVSRVAVSKWETGRGYPNIDSLQLIAKVFNTTIDDLLSSSEFIDIAKEEKNKFSGVLNLLSILLFVLPIFRSVLPNGDIVSTWIFSVNYSSVVSFILDFSCIVISVFIGFYRVINKRETKTKILISCLSFVFMILCFALTLQPYPAVFSLVLFAVLLKVSVL